MSDSMSRHRQIATRWIHHFCQDNVPSADKIDPICKHMHHYKQRQAHPQHTGNDPETESDDNDNVDGDDNAGDGNAGMAKLVMAMLVMMMMEMCILMMMTIMMTIRIMTIAKQYRCVLSINFQKFNRSACQTQLQIFGETQEIQSRETACACKKL